MIECRKLSKNIFHYDVVDSKIYFRTLNIFKISRKYKLVYYLYNGKKRKSYLNVNDMKRKNDFRMILFFIDNNKSKVYAYPAMLITDIINIKNYGGAVIE